MSFENSFCSMAFMGLPWPKKSTGIFEPVARGSVSLRNSFKFMEEAVKGIKGSSLRKFFRFMEDDRYCNGN